MERVDVATDQIGFSDSDEGDRLRPLRSAQAVAVGTTKKGRVSRGSPTRARARALAAPMPELPPVTRAFWSYRGRAADEAMATSLRRSREPRQEPHEAAI